MMTDKSTNGIAYTEEIARINGASFILFPEDTHTKEMIKQAIREFRDSRDVVSMRIATEADRDENYRDDIFRNPAVRHLRWYEINADDPAIIRKERLNGTTPPDFINRFVLPCIADTVQRNLNMSGYQIFEF